MAERGAQPEVPKVPRRTLQALRAFFTPLLPDDYLEQINPMWTTRELRGRIEEITREGDDAATITIRPSWRWPGHRPGQYLRIGLVIDGRHHWRAYSLTSEPDREDGRIAITPKLVESGTVSSYLLREAGPGTLVRLGGVEGAFVLPDPVPERLLFITAGSGVTPVMSMLRALRSQGDLRDAVHLHSSRTESGTIFGEELRGLDAFEAGYRLHLQITGRDGRLTPAALDELCPDWREREAFLCGPTELIEALRERWEQDGDPERLHLEHFEPVAGVGEGERGAGGRIKFLSSDKTAESDGSKPILEAGEDAGATLPFGCRMGICHTCVGKLCSGQVRDLRTGEVSGSPGETVRTCVNAPEGDVEIYL
jgi:stearoyl-CoA 9-desaturase NADPH oxidoreductase